jgi:hypothetical protein
MYNIILLILFYYYFSFRKIYNIKQNNNKICVISSKNKKNYENNITLKENNTNVNLKENNINVNFKENNTNIYVKESINKKLITISPGGLKGFYLLGILSYLKENYDIIKDDFIYSGASAGAWNALFMCYKGDTMKFIYDLLEQNIKKAKNAEELQYYLKYKLLSKYKDSDFDLTKLYIGVTTFKNFSPRINIYSDFENLEDAINCCIASSHIPLLTGGITNRYKNMYSLDGGFSNYPYLSKDRILHISPSMWNNINSEEKNPIKKTILSIKKFFEFFSLSKNNLLELFDNGYQDAKNNKEYFDNLFTAISTNYSKNL